MPGKLLPAATFAGDWRKLGVAIFVAVILVQEEVVVHLCRLLVFAVSFLVCSRALSQKFINPVPLKKSVKAGVSACVSRSLTKVPMITWGGDMTTIHANGNQAATDSGSILGKKGLNLKLVRQDNFKTQLEEYLRCDSPYLRGTLAMINMAAEAAAADPRTELKVIYQMTWSAGGDAMVVKGNITKPRDLKGKTIVLQAYGPHIDYLGKLLSDAGLSTKDVTIKWVADLTGTDNSPMNAFYKKNIDAAMVILPDALALTSGGKVGTGAEASVKGARILLSTKSANRIIADVYAVRSDYLKAQKAQVAKFVQGLMEAEAETRRLFKGKKQNAKQGLLKASAKMLLDSPQATADAEGLFLDAEPVGWAGNKRFFANPKYPRRFERLNAEISSTLKSLGLIRMAKVDKVEWDYDDLKKGKVTEKNVETRFDREAVAKLVNRRGKQQGVGDDSLFQFEVFFQPNQNEFAPGAYAKDFDRVINLASTYGGAVITVEGHSDPLGFLKKKKKGATNVVLNRVKQAAKNLSLTRANAVRDSVVGYAKGKGIGLDPTQFAVVGHGIDRPVNGRCGSDPCAPKTKNEWLANMRVEFRIIQVEAEEEVFNPL